MDGALGAPPGSIGCRSARALGSDVPFFLAGTAALVEGTGERVTPAGTLPPWHVLIVKPPAAVSTAAAYAAIDRTERPSRASQYFGFDRGADRTAAFRLRRGRAAAAERLPRRHRVERAGGRDRNRRAAGRGRAACCRVRVRASLRWPSRHDRTHRSRLELPAVPALQTRLRARRRGGMTRDPSCSPADRPTTSRRRSRERRTKPSCASPASRWSSASLRRCDRRRRSGASSSSPEGFATNRAALGDDAAPTECASPKACAAGSRDCRRTSWFSSRRPTCRCSARIVEEFVAGVRRWTPTSSTAASKRACIWAVTRRSRTRGRACATVRSAAAD